MAAVTSAGRASGLEPLGLELDSRAEEALFQRNAARVFGFCLARLRRREDAEDAVQTTFLYAVRSLRRGVVPLVESAWLLGIARNVCLERWEAARKCSRVEAIWDPVELERETAAPQEQRDDLIGLEEALSRLPAQQRRAVLLRDWRGLSYDEVAAQLGVSNAAVETLIFRGRRTLAAQLRDGTQATRRRLASLANVGSLFSAAKAALTGGAAAIKIAGAITVVAVSSAGLAAGGASLRDDRSEAPRAQKPVAGRPAPAAPTPRGSATVAPVATKPARRASAQPPGVSDSKPIRSSSPSSTATPPTAATTSAAQPAAQPAGTTPAERAGEAVAPVVKTPVEKLRDAAVPPVVQQPVEKAVDVEKAVETVLPPAVQEPVEKVAEAVAPAVPPVVPQAVETIVQSLPVEPEPVVAELPVDPPLLP